MKTRHPARSTADLWRAQQGDAREPAQGSVPDPESIHRRLNELQVYQVELELQNEELRETQQQLEAAQQRYRDLYDQAPVGYCSVNQRGLVFEVNRTLVTWMRGEHGDLLSRPFASLVVESDRHSYQRALHQMREAASSGATSSSATEPCELRLRRFDGTLTWVQLGASPVINEAGEVDLRLALTDIEPRIAVQHRSDQVAARLTAELEQRRRRKWRLRR